MFEDGRHEETDLSYDELISLHQIEENLGFTREPGILAKTGVKLKRFLKGEIVSYEHKPRSSRRLATAERKIAIATSLGGLFGAAIGLSAGYYFVGGEVFGETDKSCVEAIEHYEGGEYYGSVAELDTEVSVICGISQSIMSLNRKSAGMEMYVDWEVVASNSGVNLNAHRLENNLETIDRMHKIQRLFLGAISVLGLGGAGAFVSDRVANRRFNQ